MLVWKNVRQWRHDLTQDCETQATKRKHGINNQRRINDIQYWQETSGGNRVQERYKWSPFCSTTFPVICHFVRITGSSRIIVGNGYLAPLAERDRVPGYCIVDSANESRREPRFNQVKVQQSYDITIATGRDSLLDNSNTNHNSPEVSKTAIFFKFEKSRP